MTAKELIEIADKKGYSIVLAGDGKNKYYYSWTSKMNRSHEREFHGTFHEFVEFVKEL